MRKNTKIPALTKKKLIHYGNYIQILKIARKYGLNIVTISPYGNAMYRKMSLYCSSNAYKSLSDNIIFNEKESRLEITTKYYSGKACTYILDLNDEDICIKSGLDCYIQFSRANKIYKAEDYHYDKLDRWYDKESGKYVCSAKPILDYNPKYEKIPLINVYEYDLNSAYMSTLLKVCPDLEHPIYDSKVKKNQVGFLIDDDLTMTYKGQADVVFNLIPTPEKWLKYIDKWYNKKKASKGLLKQEAKAMLNLPIGYCQRTNPFLRAYVVHTCNNIIRALINDQTIMWNTDALFSLNRRVDLLLGDEIGMFKEIRLKKFIYIGNNYQVNDNLPTYRGIPKGWYDDDITLEDVANGLVTRCNKYIWDPISLELKKNERSLYEEINQSSEG